MAKTHSLKQIAFGTMLDQSQPLIWTLKAKANAVAGANDFEAGDLVYRTGGYVNIATVDTIVLGVALEPSQDAIADIQVLVVTAMTGLAVSVLADNAQAAHTLVQTNGGEEYSLAIDSSNNWHIDIANTGALKVKIHKFIDPVDDINARVIAIVKASKREVL